MTELKPCPFCGSEEIEILSSLKGFVAVCPNCECVERFGYKKTSAAEAWNQRSNGWVKIEDIPKEWKDDEKQIWLFKNDWHYVGIHLVDDLWMCGGDTISAPTHAMLPTPPEE